MHFRKTINSRDDWMVIDKQRRTFVFFRLVSCKTYQNHWLKHPPFSSSFLSIHFFSFFIFFLRLLSSFLFSFLFISSLSSFFCLSFLFFFISLFLFLFSYFRSFLFLLFFLFLIRHISWRFHLFDIITQLHDILWNINFDLLIKQSAPPFFRIFNLLSCFRFH